MNAPESVRFALVIEYHGAPFHGWQLQPHAPTVQGELERVLLRITGGGEASDRVMVTGAGRTDRGVHASGQVASVILPSTWTAAALRKALNALLHRSIRVREVRRVPMAFHPRFDARRRSYLYQLGTAPETASPFLRPFCWPVDRRPPDPELLKAAAAKLPGDRRWRAFAQAGQEHLGDRCQVLEAGWAPWSGHDGQPLGWRFRIRANRYLHHMVRYLVGTMVAIGRGDRPLAELDALLDDPTTRLVTSPPAPPDGLFLARVEYEPGCWGDDPDRDAAGAPSDLDAPADPPSADAALASPIPSPTEG